MKLRASLREEPAQMVGFVEEVLCESAHPHSNSARLTTRDVEIGGETIPAGERVLLSFAAANRDPSKFADPDRLDLARGARGHLAFGWGIHQCVGAALARQELLLLTERLCALPQVELAGAPESGVTQGGIHLGLRTLPLPSADAGRLPTGPTRGSTCPPPRTTHGPPSAS